MYLQEEESQERFCQCAQIPDQGYKEDGAILFSVVPKARGNGCKLKQEIPFKDKEKLFSCGVGQFAQRGCGIPILGDAQNSSGHMQPKQPALDDPTLNRGGWTGCSLEPSILSHSVVL